MIEPFCVVSSTEFKPPKVKAPPDKALLIPSTPTRPSVVMPLGTEMVGFETNWRF